MWQNRSFLHPVHFSGLAETVVLDSWNDTALLLGNAHRTLWQPYLVCSDKNPPGRAHNSSLLCQRQTGTEFHGNTWEVKFFYLKICFIGHCQSNSKLLALSCVLIQLSMEDFIFFLSKQHDWGWVSEAGTFTWKMPLKLPQLWGSVFSPLLESPFQGKLGNNRTMEAVLSETTTFTSYSRRKVEQGHIYPVPPLFSSHISRASSLYMGFCLGLQHCSTKENVLS